MARVVRAVDRLLERAQQDRLQQREVRAASNLVQQLGVVLGPRHLAAGQLQPELGQEVAQRRDLLRRRHVVHPEEHRLAALREQVAGREVGRQHALLDQAVRVVARLGNDLLDLALRVEHHPGLERLEIDRAAPAPLLGQPAVDLVQRLQVRRRPARRQPLPYLVVRQACARADHRRVELIARHHALGRDHHLAHHRQAVDLGVERAQAVGDLLRQHRDHAPREIDRGAALERIRVERLAVPHVVADVRDRDPEPETASVAHRVHRVVEVLRRLAVDGDEAELAQVAPVREVLLAHLLGQRARRRQRLLRELVRQVELAQRDLDLHPGVGVVAQYFGHAPDGLRVLRRLRHQLDGHHLARLRASGLLRRHQDVLRDAAVLGHQEHHPMLGVQPAHDAPRGAFEHLDDLARRPAARVAPGDAHRGAVAVQCLAHLGRRQEHLRAAVVGNQEAVPVAMAFDAAGEQSEPGGHQQAAGAVLDHRTRALQARDGVVEVAPFAAADIEAVGELVGRERRAGGVQRREDFLRVGVRRRRLRALGAPAPAQRCLARLLL